MAEGVKWLRMPLPLGLDHINLYLVADEDENGPGWLIIDTGISNDVTRALWQQILAGPLAGQRITGVLCTHYHYDHAGLAGWLTEMLRVPLYMSYGEYFTLRTLAASTEVNLSWQYLEYFQRAGFPAEHLDDLGAVLAMASQLISSPPTAFRRLRAGQELTLAGHRWQLHLGEGHVAEHMLLHDAQRNILIAGDQLLPRITSNVSVLPSEPEGDLIGDWLGSLARLQALPEQTLVLPAHELPYHGLQTRIQQLQRHHGQHLDHLRRLCQSQAPTIYEATQQLFAHRGKLQPIDQMMAQGECLAHLNYLHQCGELERSLDETGCYRYRCRY